MVAVLVATALLTEMFMGADVELFPAASLTIARRICVPFATCAVFHASEYGAAVSAEPTLLPSIWNWMLATPVLSDAFATIVTDPDTVALLTGELTDTDGATVSPGLVTDPCLS